MRAPGDSATGNSIGAERATASTPAAPATRQKASPCRARTACGSEEGTKPETTKPAAPVRTAKTAPTIHAGLRPAGPAPGSRRPAAQRARRPIARARTSTTAARAAGPGSGREDSRTRAMRGAYPSSRFSRKSKMRVLPGFIPVAKVAQATGDSEGLVVSRGTKAPASASCARFGSSPSAIIEATASGSAPSKPSTSTRSNEVSPVAPAGAACPAGPAGAAALPGAAPGTASTASTASVRSPPAAGKRRKGVLRGPERICRRSVPRRALPRRPEAGSAGNLR